MHRGRAEQFWGELTAPVVTARAVAPLGELARWSLPLLSPGGSMLALKGASAQEELDGDRPLCAASASWRTRWRPMAQTWSWPETTWCG